MADSKVARKPSNVSENTLLRFALLKDSPLDGERFRCCH